MNANELREKSTSELETMLLDLFRDQFQYRMQQATHQLKQTHVLKKVRRDIARIKTILNEKAGV